MRRAVSPRAVRRRAAASALLAVSFGGAAIAQTADDGEEVVLESIVVLGKQEDATGPVGDSNNPPTVTGSKAPVYVTEIPQSLSVLGTEDLKRFGADRVSEALRYTPGVTTDVFGDDNDYDWLRIRGFQADQTGVFLDNAQNLSYAFGSFFIDPYTLERVEVLRGPSSALYGGSNPGGIVNYVSKRPGERVREVVVGVEDAPAGFVAFDYGDPVGDGGGYRVVGRLKGGDKYDDLNEGLRGTFAPSFKVRTDSGTEVTLLANLHLADEKHNGSTFLPYVGTVEAAPGFGHIDPDANFSDPDWDKYSREQFSATAIVEHTFDNDFTLTGIGRVGVASLEERYWYPYGYSGFATAPAAGDTSGALSLVAFEHDTLVRTAQSDIRYYGSVETGPATHDLLFGVDARYYWLDETQASAIGSNQVVNPTAPGTPSLFVYKDAVTTQQQIGLYVQDQLRFGDGWILTGNLRHDFVETEQSGTTDFTRHDSATSYRAGLGYEFENGLTPYVSYSSFFNPLIASEGVTKPESGDQYEAGLKWAPEGGDFSLMAAAFQIDRENAVTGVSPSLSQLGEVRSRGLEFEGRYDFGNGLEVAATATFLDLEIMYDANSALIGKSPTLTPEREIALRADYAFSGGLEGLSLGAGVRHRGESYANAANTLTVPDSTVFDLFAGYQLTDNVAVNVSATNIADERYVTGCQDEYVCSYGSGREVALTLTATW